jgi:hypothetical protein
LARGKAISPWGARFGAKAHYFTTMGTLMNAVASTARAARNLDAAQVNQLSNSLACRRVCKSLFRHFSIRTATFDAVSDRFVALNSPWYGKRNSAGFAPLRTFAALIGARQPMLLIGHPTWCREMVSNLSTSDLLGGLAVHQETGAG